MNRFAKPIIYSTTFLSFLFCSCNTGEQNGGALNTQYKAFNDTTEVMVVELETSSFQKEIRSNGKVYARKKSILKFNVAGRINNILFKNGDFIKTGDAIAVLYTSEQLAKVEEFELALRVARLEYDDALISYAGGFDTTKLSSAMRYAADLRSGYGKALANLRRAKLEHEWATLRAPFSGQIANLSKKPFEFVNNDDEFCLLIDASDFEVEFSLVESEVSDVQLRDSIEVSMFSNDQRIFNAVVSEINPLVDEYGLVKMKGRVQHAVGLLEGMNVKVLLKKRLFKQFSVPKSAVINRGEQSILFKYVKGRAIWTYVIVVDSNSTHYSVVANIDRKGFLAEGDSIIISHNMDLVHNSLVRLTK